MSSTNKTPNYNLSQFEATDKPGWLPDYNTDMSKIDSAIHAVSESVPTTDTFQEKLISGRNIKTINNQSLLGEGNITIDPAPQIKTLNNKSLIGTGNLALSNINGVDITSGSPINLQETLVSGTNIKTINNQSLLGNGNIALDNTGVKLAYFYSAPLDNNRTFSGVEYATYNFEDFKFNLLPNHRYYFAATATLFNYNDYSIDTILTFVPKFPSRVFSEINGIEITIGKSTSGMVSSALVFDPNMYSKETNPNSCELHISAGSTGDELFDETAKTNTKIYYAQALVLDLGEAN